MTSDIRTQVENVAAMIDEMVHLTVESEEHAKTSSEDLDSLVKTTGTMSELSSEVEHILHDFKRNYCFDSQFCFTITFRVERSNYPLFKQ